MQKIIITAGATGIGLAMARAFAQNGDQVAVCDNNADALAQLPATLRPHQADVADETQMGDFMAAAIAALGGLDVLINNAGIAGPQGPIDALAADQWRHCIAVNLHGAFYATRAAAARMKSQRAGCIINIASNAGTHGMPDRAPYVASKWAIVGLTQALAMELGEYNIRVNAICPGSVQGDRMDRVIKADAANRGITEQQVRAEYTGQMSLRRFIRADEIAATALFLANTPAISGQALAVDGNTETLGRLTRPQ